MYEQSVVSTEWTDENWDKVTQWLKSHLKTDVVTITFTKKDGTERVMHCTLDPARLPPVVVTEDKKERKVNDNIMSVYDVDAKGDTEVLVDILAKKKGFVIKGNKPDVDKISRYILEEWQTGKIKV